MTAQTSSTPTTNKSVPTTLPARLSPSALDRYRTCPRSFLLHEVQRKARQQKPSPLFAQGSAVHHALERFFGLPVEDRSTETLHQALRWAWPQHRKPGSFSSKEQEADYGRAALAMLTAFADSFELSAIPIAREQWVAATLPGGVEVYGKLDRIDRRGENGLEVIDYKTGRHRLEPEDVPKDSAALVYLLGAEERYDMEVARVRIIYLAEATETIWEPEREDIVMARGRLQGIVEQIQADETWEPNPGPQCRWCPVALSCEARDRISTYDIRLEEEVPF